MSGTTFESEAAREPARVSDCPGATHLDTILPSWDATRIERRVISATPGSVYDALLHADFLDAVRANPAVRLLFALRGAAERVVTFLRRRPAPAVEARARLRLIDMPGHGEWVLLANDPPKEVVFGVIGRFWSGETKWQEIDAAHFASFHTPGFARIGCNFVVDAMTGGRTLLTYEARTQATDPASRRAFLRYWRLVSPFVGVVMRSMLSLVARTAE